ncbi:MAG: YggS family pyridoxal phosphate-dependent enzyme [candidate division KSB1 bacterium]|nr:YggS family pyridoxal phosphate-dependent enzyme [candidate division KSB1 bacterium]
MSIPENIREIQRRIRQTCEKVGRSPEEIEIVAVSKTFSPEKIQEAVQCGIRHIGENRVQEAWAKFQQLGNIARWHLVGHLQTNKVKKALQIFQTIQSVDTLYLGKEISKRVEDPGKPVEILVQVNTSGEKTKFGVSPERAIELVKELSLLSGIKVLGLMTIGAFLPDPEEVRPCFRILKELKEEILEQGIEGVEMKYLSMGMTDDFEVAIEEGANMIRIGRAIFGER